MNGILSPEKDIYAVYAIVGTNPGRVRMLLHIADREEPGDYTLFRSAILMLHANEFVPEFVVDKWLTDLCENDDGIFYAIGMDGVLFNNRLGRWTSSVLDPNFSCNAIRFIKPAAIFVTGTNGLFAEVKNERPQKIDIKTDADIVDLAGNSIDNVCLIGGEGNIWTYKRGVIASIDSPTTQYLCGIAVTADETFYICGEEGLILRGKDDKWECIIETESDIFSVAVHENIPYFAASESGLVRFVNNKIETVLGNWYADSVFCAAGSIFTCAATEVLCLNADGSQKMLIRLG